MKKLGAIALLLGLGMFALGCEKAYAGTPAEIPAETPAETPAEIPAV